MIAKRLSQYSALWVGGFLLVLIIAAGASLLGGLDLIDVADALLPAAFLVLGAGLVLGLGLTLASPAGLVTKTVVSALGVVLVLPLLWAPVLAVVIVAAIERVTIEYSTAYAQFRIIVSQLIYPLVAMVVEGPLVGAVWSAFQVLASIVGFVASALQVWRVLRGVLVAQQAEA